MFTLGLNSHQVTGQVQQTLVQLRDALQAAAQLGQWSAGLSAASQQHVTGPQ